MGYGGASGGAGGGWRDGMHVGRGAAAVREAWVGESVFCLHGGGGVRGGLGDESDGRPKPRSEPALFGDGMV